MGSVDKRIEDLERRFGGREHVVEIGVVQGEDEEPLYSFLLTPGGRRFGESFERDFERSLQYARRRVEEGTVSRADLEGSSPMTIAAVYAVLASRGNPLAEEIRELYEEVRETGRRHHATRELEEYAPGIGAEFDRFFWEVVERHAHKPEE